MAINENLDWWSASHVGDQEIHGNVFTIHVIVYHGFDWLRHQISVQVQVILQKMMLHKMIWVKMILQDMILHMTVLVKMILIEMILAK